MMKRILSYVLPALLFFYARHMHGQIVIDLSTGVDNVTGLPQPVNSAVSPFNSVDDTWKVSNRLSLPPNVNGYYIPAPAGPYHPVPIGNGTQGPATPCFPTQSASSPHEPGGSVRWIAPSVDANGNHLESQAGLYYYRMSFQWPPCPMADCGGGNTAPPKKSTLQLDYIGSGQLIHSININGVQIIGSGFGSTTPGGISGTSNITLPADANPLPNTPNIVPGTNYVDVVMFHYGFDCAGSFPYGFENGMGFTGLEIKGRLILEPAGLNNTAPNANQDYYCIGDDAIIALDAPGTTDYTLDLSEIVGGVEQPFPSKHFTGFPSWINLSDIYSGPVIPNWGPVNPNFFHPGTYRIKITLHTPCGSQVITKDFTYSCCDNADANFSLNMTNYGNTLEAKSEHPGSHQWDVYTAPSINTGPYTPVALGIYWQKIYVDHPSACYYVKHTITTSCGTACTAKRFCQADCKQKSCNLDQKPQNVKINPRGSTITWDPMAGAVHYMVEIDQNSPHCCWTNGQNVHPLPYATTYTVDNPTFQPTFTTPPTIPGYPPTPLCFSVRVWAICADGSLSLSSDPICSNGQAFVPRPAVETGVEELGNSYMEMDVFPNPSKGQVNIAVKTPVESEVSISIYSSTGAVVKSFDGLRTSNRAARVLWDAEPLGKGIFLVKVSTPDHTSISKKVIID